MKLLDKIQNGVYTIAEMSANHAGKLENALEIVRAAKKAGADCLKIQTYTADSLTIDCDNEYFKIKGGLWDGYSLYQLYSEAATPYEWQTEIKAECERVGIDFLSTPFDRASVDFLETLGVEAYKVASFELVDIPLIRYIAKQGKPMIVSCGMGSMEEIQDAMDAMLGEGLSRGKIILLKCTSEYPAETKDMNLRTIADMIERFGVIVGLSDHSIGTLAPITAVALGAKVIEKHFCLSRDLKNPDSDFSTEPAEFAEMTNSVRQAYEARGVESYGPGDAEKSNLAYRRSIFAIEDIRMGDIFCNDNTRIIRPGAGLQPKYYDALIGSASKTNYRKGMPILMNEVTE
ncbi:N-acetylneuraminic acid synthase [Clostridia bacterium]|nr:N-acetylneuraminic acid synthase [Clostridia bacterium]